jgi:hypothetical protein
MIITETSQSTAWVESLWPFPDHRDLYLLVAGILVGVLLSPAVMGQIAPSWQSEIFGGARIEQELDKLERDWQRKQQTLADASVSQAAVKEARQRHLETRNRLQQAMIAVRDQRAARLMVSIMLTLGLVMVLEALLAPQPEQGKRRAAVPRTLGRLKTVRYALLAIWAALLLARPGLLSQSTLIFTALLVIVALVVGLVPLNRREAKGEA